MTKLAKKTSQKPVKKAVKKAAKKPAKKAVKKAVKKPVKKPLKKPVINIINDNGLYILEGALSHFGNVVVSHSKEIIEEIAVEWWESGKLDAVNNFGFYSAYCTYRDRIVDKPFVTLALAENLARTDHLIGPGSCTEAFCPWPGLHEHRAMAHLLLKELGISGSDDPSSKEFQLGLFKYLESLADYEKAGFCLLNGTFGVPITMSLLLLHNKIPWHHISDIFNAHYQIDDWDSYPQQNYNLRSVELIAKFVELMRHADPMQRKSA